MTGADWALELLHKPSREALEVRPKRILVCCQAHIGDAILASSALPVLTAAFPDAKLGFLAHSASAEVFTDNPRLEWLHTFDHWRLNRQPIPILKKFGHYLRSFSLAIQEIRAIKYDLAIDLYPYFPNSIPLLYSAGIPARLGWTSAGLGALLTHALNWEDGPGHVVEWHKRLLGMIVSCRPHLDLALTELYVSDAIQGQWKKIAAESLIPKKYITFHIGSGGVHRHWPIGHWKQLTKLCLDSGLAIVLLGHGPPEMAICSEIAELSCNIHDLSGKLFWRVMTEAIAKSQLLVGLESASGHIAAAQKVPSVCIYSGTTRSSTWKPYLHAARVVVHSVPCSPCYLSTGCEGMECVRLTQPETVFNEISAILKLIKPTTKNA